MGAILNAEYSTVPSGENTAPWFCCVLKLFALPPERERRVGGVLLRQHGQVLVSNSVNPAMNFEPSLRSKGRWRHYSPFWRAEP
jgi:hypothetical protein